MSNDDLIAIGFKSMPHFTVMNSVNFDLGRNRYLSAGAVGTPNEMLFICERDEMENSCIVLHNWDYDGALTIEKVQQLIQLLTTNK